MTLSFGRAAAVSPSRRTVGLTPGWRAALAGALAVALAGTACSREQPAALRVFAAASLTDVALELARRYDASEIEVSVGSSSALARQIRDGARGDIFLAASPAWIEYLDDAGALAGPPIVVARNELVCVTAASPPPNAQAGGSWAAGVHHPAALLAALPPGAGVAIADAGVPAGEYAREALRQLGLLDRFRPYLVGQRDVRAALAAVERGELSAGFVYRTDARDAAVDILFAFDATSHPPIEYRAAVLRDTTDPAAAQRFLAYLRGDTARSVLAHAGFAPP